MSKVCGVGLTNWPGSLPDLAVVGGGVSVCVAVVMGDSHVVQSVVLWWEGAGVRQAVGLVGHPVRRAEALGWTDGTGPFAGVNVWVKGAVPLKAIFFSSMEREK